jgi:hypothetical protein
VVAQAGMVHLRVVLLVSLSAARMACLTVAAGTAVATAGLTPCSLVDRPGGVDQADMAERLRVVADRRGAHAAAVLPGAQQP